MSREEGKEVEIAQLLSEGKYDLPVFLRYLKSFAMDGAQPDKAILLGILMQSLARFHTSDFTSCMCLVATHVQEASSVEKEFRYIYELENFLSCGEYAKFWAKWSVVKEHLPESFHFETRVRTSILDNVSFTVERIPSSRLATYLAVPVDQLQKTIENAKKQDGDFECRSISDQEVVFALNEFNHPVVSANQDAVKFEDIVSILSASAQ